MNSGIFAQYAWAWLLPVTIVLPLISALLMLAVKRAPVLPAVALSAAPALLLAFLGPAGAETFYPGVLLGLQLGLDSTGHVFLVFTSVLWAAAGFYSAYYIDENGFRRSFFFFHFLCMAGNAGVILAADIPGFYMFFALMSLSAYGLVIHDRTAEAFRAGRVYIVMAVLGEALLALGLFLVADAAGSLDLASVPAAVAASSNRDLMVALILSGFGIKAGLVFLHMWLPLAHPVAPAPASALLSGAMIKAGLLGWLRFLPLGHISLPGWGWLCVALGLFGAFYGVLAGVLQGEKKTILAYSSVSQMGIMTAGIGIGLVSAEAWPAALAAVLVYALHHAFAKGALFLSTGVEPRPGHSILVRAFLFAGILIPALALAGAPLTTGALAKSALKESITHLPEEAAAALAFALQASAAATTLLMARFISVARAGGVTGAGHAASAGLLAPWAALIALAPAAAFLLPGAAPWSKALSLSAFVSSAAPVAAGTLAFVIIARLPRITGRWAVPPGDILAIILPAAQTLNGWLTKIRDADKLPTAVKTRMEILFQRCAIMIERLEEGLLTGAAGWTFFIAITIAISLLIICQAY